MLKRLRKFIYKVRLEDVFRNMDIKKLIDIMVKYNKFMEPGRFGMGERFYPEPDVSGFEQGNGVYDIFYKNIHIYYQSTPDQNICRISLKKEEDVWVLGDNFSEGIKTMEVYLTYDIEVLGNLRCCNTIFKDGNWNEYVYNVLFDMRNIIHGYTIESEFNNEYSYKKCKSGEQTL
jgi:hypothetical protein